MGNSVCVFCTIAAGPETALVHRDDRTAAFLDHRPLFRGHVLVVPREHHVDLPGLPPDLLEPLFAAVRRVSAALPEALGCGGTFLAVNNGVSQSVPHLHVHVIPRTRGDGLKGFFWPREKYEDAADEENFRRRIAEIVAARP